MPFSPPVFFPTLRMELSIVMDNRWCYSLLFAYLIPLYLYFSFSLSIFNPALGVNRPATKGGQEALTGVLHPLKFSKLIFILLYLVYFCPPNVRLPPRKVFRFCIFSSEIKILAVPKILFSHKLHFSRILYAYSVNQRFRTRLGALHFHVFRFLYFASYYFICCLFEATKQR